MGLETLGALTFYRFDPARLRIAATPRGAGFVPQTAAQVAAAGYAAVLNGPMFSLCSGESARVAQDHPGCTGNCTYQYTQCESLDYAHVDAGAGIYAAGDNPGRGIVLAVVDGRGVASTGGVPSSAAVAVQLYPALVAEGVAQNTSAGGSNLETVWRSALALMGDGTFALVVGRMTMAGFAGALRAAGAVAAGYTDGGGSTALLAEGTRVGSSENRPVPSWLVVGEPGGGGLGGGSAGVLALGVGALAAAAVWWALRRSG